MRSQRAACAGLLSAGLLFAAGRAFAQDAATAGALFDKGVLDMQAGRFDNACPALEESQQLDPHPGTLFTLAECQAKWGKVASAVQHYQDYTDLVSRLPPAQQARHRERVGIAKAQLGKLKPSVPTLTLVLPATAPRETTVTRNGVALQGAALGLALPVDPGQYVIVTHLPSGAEHSATVSIALGDAKRVELDVSQPAALVSPASEPAAPAPSVSPGSAPPAESQRKSNTLAYVIGGIGVAGVAVGSVTGILVFGKKSTVKDDCVGSTCSSAGVSAANSGKTLAIVSDIGFGIGIVGLATSAVLLLTRPKAEPDAQVLAPRWEPLLASTPGGAWAGLGHRF
jgi:hypothetical protein